MYISHLTPSVDRPGPHQLLGGGHDRLVMLARSDFLTRAPYPHVLRAICGQRNYSVANIERRARPLRLQAEAGSPQVKWLRPGERQVLSCLRLPSR
jgi:hypothetical protein